MDAKFTVNSGSNLYWSGPKYTCSKHGVITSTVSILETRDSPREEYCMECYKDWIRANLLPVTPVT